ncbi:hypothetical protein Scep_018729 [Stephania cephalantha]|uniref:Myosin motor domain-containing protein n=1 Tax=Stephania cephalantha TaxID=152367 RepID=A0AAP0I9R0_9MAGN
MKRFEDKVAIVVESTKRVGFSIAERLGKEGASVVISSSEKVLTMPKGTVLPANPNILEDTDDLVQLSFLNEPSVLYNLFCRYSQSKTYTKASPILLVMNPFKGAEVRGNELVAGCGKKPRVSPDIYYWAKDAFMP